LATLSCGGSGTSSHSHGVTVGCSVGASVGWNVGARVRQIPLAPSHVSVEQSDQPLHFSPALQAGHVPPQSSWKQTREVAGGQAP
jgi:hypothetical protein